MAQNNIKINKIKITDYSKKCVTKILIKTNTEEEKAPFEEQIINLPGFKTSFFCKWKRNLYMQQQQKR